MVSACMHSFRVGLFTKIPIQIINPETDISFLY